MLTDSELKIKGYEILRKELGEPEAEKFIFLLIKDPFDYSVWMKNLFEKKNIYGLSKEAKVFRDKSKES